MHVEHIYPKAKTAHPNLKKKWRNFLLACPTCNTYKSQHLGENKQNGLLKRFLWPHLDNTFNAFAYHKDGSLTIRDGLSASLNTLAKATREMLGLLKSPDVSQDYHGRGLAYDGITKRAQAWGMAEIALAAYTENQTPTQLDTINAMCSTIGHFSIWMEVFKNHPDVRKVVIRVSKAAPNCFDASTTRPILRGRI